MKNIEKIIPNNPSKPINLIGWQNLVFNKYSSAIEWKDEKTLHKRQHKIPTKVSNKSVSWESSFIALKLIKNNPNNIRPTPIFRMFIF